MKEATRVVVKGPAEVIIVVDEKTDKRVQEAEERLERLQRRVELLEEGK